MIRVFLCVLAAVSMLSGSAMAQPEEQRLIEAVETGEIIRLHVVAAGDDVENQRIKLVVRDKVLLAWREALSGVDSAQDMMAFLQENREGLQEAALLAAREEGFAGEVSAQVGVFPFPDRWYDSVLVPAGDYRALRIVLGEGEGKNWWCVLFPSLCLSLAAEEPQEAPETEEAREMKAEEVEPSFSWWVREVFYAWPLAAPV